MGSLGVAPSSSSGGGAPILVNTNTEEEQTDFIFMVKDSGDGNDGIDLDDLFNTRTFSVLTSFASIGFAFSHIT